VVVAAAARRRHRPKNPTLSAGDVIAIANTMLYILFKPPNP